MLKREEGRRGRALQVTQSRQLMCAEQDTVNYVLIDFRPHLRPALT